MTPRRLPCLPVTFAEVCEAWRDPDKPEDDPGGGVMTCSIITTDASEKLSWMHSRLLACIPEQMREAWLDPRRF